MTDRLPCPFCGSSDVGHKHHAAYSSDSNFGTFGCLVCGAGFIAQDDYEESPADIAEWNRRDPAGGVARAYVDGDHASRELRWMVDMPSFDLPVGTKLYVAPVAVQEEGDAKNLRPLSAGLPEVDGLLCLTFCDDPAVPYPWRVQQWMAARNCWENEWHTFGKGKGKRWISHWMTIEELKP